MPSANDLARAEELSNLFRRTQKHGTPLDGLATESRLECLVQHVISSERRNRYLKVIQTREIASSATIPFSGSFDPIKASVAYARAGDLDNAYWLVFLITHFGRHRVGEWRYLEETFGRINGEGLWNWQAVSHDPIGFRVWLGENRPYLQRPGAGFGNHRKYESLDPWSPSGMGSVVNSYVDWVRTGTSHMALMQAFTHGVTHEVAFERAFRSLSSVHRFGRTARFDYLMMGNRLEFHRMRPGHAYLTGATGPLRGASLLLDGTTTPTRSAAALGDALVELGQAIGVEFDVLEDALCNWQKHPNLFKPFRG